jgi:RNA polymerase sigma factor (sigma-70 family)
MKRREPCIEWAELLALRPEDLSPTDRASLAAHLAVCLACAAVNNHYRRIQASLEALPAPAIEPLPYAWKGESRHELEKNQQMESATAILEQYGEYIEALVRQYMSELHHSAESIELEIEDLVQEVIIKFWQALNERAIASPKAYIRAIVHNKIIDILRSSKPQLLLSFAGGEQPELPDLIDEIVERILALPPRQQRAMICYLQERLDDDSLLAEAFLRFGVDIRSIRCPEEESERQLLRSSLAGARRRLRLKLSHLQERAGRKEKAETPYADQIAALLGIQ